MKKMMIVILALLAAGGFAEMKTKEQVKQQLFFDAQDKELLTSRIETDKTFKQVLFQVGFSQDDIISLAKEYSSKYPKNIGNLLDSDLRSIATLGDVYFTGLPKIDHSKAEETAQGGLPWWAWALIGAGAVSLIGGGIFGRGRG